MKKTTLLFLTFFLTAGLLYPRQIRLLTIGNSFSDDAVEHFLYGLAAAEGDTIVIGNMYIGGCSLETHYANALNDAPAYSYRKIVGGRKHIIPNYKLSEALVDEEWDYISFQQVSSLSGKYETYFPYITFLKKYAEDHLLNRNARFILHVTWAYAGDSTHEGFANYNRDQLTMYHAIIDATKRVAETTGIAVMIPAGTAIQNGRTSPLGDSFCRDGFHLQLTYGRYTASCTWYEILFGKSVVGNSYLPQEITPCQALIAQLSAHYAVRNPFEITPVVLCEASGQDVVTP
jgi:hypothetical protein